MNTALGEAILFFFIQLHAARLRLEVWRSLVTCIMDREPYLNGQNVKLTKQFMDNSYAQYYY